MKLATARMGQRTAAVRVDVQRAVELDFPDLAELRRPDWRTIAPTATVDELDLNEVVFAPCVRKPFPGGCRARHWKRALHAGPYMVTSDELGDDGLALSCRVGGGEFQPASTPDLLFGPAELVAYTSTVITLVPADITANRHARR